MDDRTQLMSATPLETGFQISWYTIREVLGTGGFGVTYLAHDNNLDRQVAIKEYLPTSFAHRHGDQSVKPLTMGQEDNFSWGLANFLKEAKTLAKFNHDNIVRVHSVFEENNTAYMVMEYESGDNLASIIKAQGTITQEFQKRIFYPIIEGLNKIHELGFIHRDIKPSNIYIRENGSPVLIDFGSARQTSLQQSSEFTALISQGYTPLEQYSSDYGDQGPWTDIYSLAATIYHGVTGKKPDDSLGRSAFMLRSQPDRVTRLSAQDYPGYEQQFLDATFAGLNLQPERRPQSLTDWQTLFQSGGAIQHDDRAADDWSGQASHNENSQRREWADTNSPQPVQTGRRDQGYPDRLPQDDILSDTGYHTSAPQRAPAGHPPPAPKKTSNWLVLSLGLLIAAIGGGAFFYLQQNKDPDSPTMVDSTVEQSPASTPATNTESADTNQPKADTDTKAVAVAEPQSDNTEVAVDTASTQAEAAPEPVAPPPVVVDATPATEPKPVVAETTAVEAVTPVVTPMQDPVALTFTQPLANDTNTPPRSIMQLADASPAFPPIEGLDEAAWKNQDCSGCHTWEKENLCAQGEFYAAKDESALTRIQHPYDGLLKSALKDWAALGCPE